MATEFMLTLHKRLSEKTYGTPPRPISETTVSAYMKTLTTLNNKQPFKNLSFLKKTDEIEKKLAEYEESTQKTLLASITSVLGLDKDKAGYKKTYKFYHDKMMEKAKTAKIEGGNVEANEKQTENWLTWEAVQNKVKELKEAVDKFSGQKHLTTEQYNTLLSYMVLSLYVEVPPRRNQDYLNMKVIKTKADKFAPPLDTFKDDNFLVIRKGVPVEFVFNKYKTSKTYGTQTIPIPEALKSVLLTFIKHNPASKDKEFAFLVASDGKPLTQDNVITRILNKTFGKKIGSSMLRHIYLSSKYDVADMKKDSNAMGHSLEEQRAYLKVVPESPSPPEAGLEVPK